MSPTQRTLRELRNQGRYVDVCERWIPNPKHPGGGFRKDLFGFGDLIAIDQDIVIIQSCNDSFAPHYRKIVDSEHTKYAMAWLKAGGKIELWSWAKRKRKNKDGKWGKGKFWRARVQEILLEDLR